ncbi:MAG TPA: hypothetical protein VK507_09985 [Iamia sp.]|nr:hypothetical protein [Iamia sp.]
MIGSVAADPVGVGDLVWAVGVTVLACVPIGVSLWALLDAARRPRWVWALSRHPQTPWMAAVAAGVLLTVVGLAISLWYLIRIRPDLAAIERGELTTTVGGS